MENIDEDYVDGASVTLDELIKDGAVFTKKALDPTPKLEHKKDVSYDLYNSKIFSFIY